MHHASYRTHTRDGGGGDGVQRHAYGSVRHVEKRRYGTCAFANRIANASLVAYECAVPSSYVDAHRSGTCVSAIVAHFRYLDEVDSDDEGGGCGGDYSGGGRCGGGRRRLQVMGLGVGTKYLPRAVLREEEGGEGVEEMGEDSCSRDDGRPRRRNYGERIRDCHAEVLARRAFVRQISLEMAADSTGDCDDDNIVRRAAGYVPILKRVDDIEDGGVGLRHAAGEKAAGRIRYRLRDGVTLHFYCSSAPCGNATLKKFAKMEREKFDPSLGPDEWPERAHEPVPAHSLRLGQFALLVKRDGSTSSSSRRLGVGRDDDGTDDDPRWTTTTIATAGPLEEEEEPRRRRGKTWPCRMDDRWCPPSCSIPNFDSGTIQSCSDKICRWNCLGLQGSLLMSVLDSPLYMSTLTVGRKFTEAICRRAVCCRAEGFGVRRRGRRGDGSNVNDDAYNDDDAADDLWRYKLNHPTLMETNVYMDETGTHDMSGVTSTGREATFESNICWVWWPGKSTNGVGYAADCLENGLVIDYNHWGDRDDAYGRDDDDATSSESSTISLVRSFHAEIIRRSDIPNDNPATLSLSDLKQLKRLVSPHHESAKDEFFRHRVFDQWSRRGCCP